LFSSSVASAEEKGKNLPFLKVGLMKAEHFEKILIAEKGKFSYLECFYGNSFRT